MNSATIPHRRRRWPWIAIVGVVAVALALWWWFGNSRSQEAQGARRPTAVLVVSTQAQARDVPVRIKANGTVTALQTVDFRPQITASVAQVNIKEGQNVHAGELLFTLDSRAEEASLKKAQAQVEKDRADLATAKRNLERQQELFRQKFISQAALDVAQNQVDTLSGQLAVDTAAIDSAKVARGYTEIRASFAGRTGTIGVRPGSLVQPNGTVLVTVTQIDPISVAFTIPEKEFPGLQQAMRLGDVQVKVKPQEGGEPFTGKVTFIDNNVDATAGTIRVKAEFPNAQARLWPGMYVNVEISPRKILNATVVPAQAVQTGPDNRFVYVVGEDKKVKSQPVTLTYVEEGFAVVDGLAPGARVVVEGAQNLRPGSVVAEAERAPPEGQQGEGKKGGKKS